MPFDFGICDLGLIDYRKAYDIQRGIVVRISQGRARSKLLFCRHRDVFTLGRGAKTGNILASSRYLSAKGISVVRVDRGGDVTYHGPGQLTVYPIFDLGRWVKDIRIFLRALEQVIIGALGRFGVCGYTIEGRRGVWVAGKKIASIGIAVRRWITYHGLSLNVGKDLRYFSRINPCGMPGVKMISLEGILGRDVGISEVRSAMQEEFRRQFAVTS
ncbi:MAG: lipoyl(octanoyl) transferase LipB [Candidatus Omnitrophota bacterium]